jgi:hypothetical protein
MHKFAQCNNLTSMLALDHAHNRFPPPWSVEEQAACFVTDSSGQKFAHLSRLAFARGGTMTAAEMIPSLEKHNHARNPHTADPS